MPGTEGLSRRERQIIDALYAIGEGGAREIAAGLNEPDAIDTIRVTVGLLERKGLVRHRVEGRRNIYSPVQGRRDAFKSAWTRITRVFFGGSPGKALLTVLNTSGDRLDDEDLDQLSEWVAEQTRRRKSR